MQIDPVIWVVTDKGLCIWKAAIYDIIVCSWSWPDKY